MPYSLQSDRVTQREGVLPNDLFTKLASALAIFLSESDNWGDKNLILFHQRFLVKMLSFFFILGNLLPKGGYSNRPEMKLKYFEPQRLCCVT